MHFYIWVNQLCKYAEVDKKSFDDFVAYLSAEREIKVTEGNYMIEYYAGNDYIGYCC